MRPSPSFTIIGALIATLAGCSSEGGKRHYSEATPQPKREASSPIVSVADPNFLEQYAATFRFRLGTPTAITCVPGGESILFLRSGPRSFVQDLYELDIASGNERVLLTADRVLAGGQEHLTAEELARRERMRMASRGIASYSLSKDGNSILVPLSGRLFVIDRKSGAQRELKSEHGYPIDPRFSPDGTSISCVRDGEVYITDVATGVEKKITTGAGGTIENGLAEFVAQEEMDRREGYWWSPDSAFIAFQQTDTTGMEVFNIADPLNPEKQPTSWPYPRAGKANAKVRLGIAGTRNGSTEPTWVRWSDENYPYLARVDWPNHGPMTILVQNRTQTKQLLLEVEPTTGGTRQILPAYDDAWINLHGSPKWLENGDSFVWVDDAGGEERVDLRWRDNTSARELTHGLRNVSLLAFDAKHAVAFVQASENAIESHIYKLSVPAAQARPDLYRPSIESPARPERLTTRPGVHNAHFADDFSCWVQASSYEDGTREWVVRGADGIERGRIASVAQDAPFRVDCEFKKVAGPTSGREFNTAIISPRNFHPGTKYPVILSVYAGPGHQQVTAATQGMLMDQWFADHGFIVARIDGRGTPGRGRDWERVIKGNLIDVALEDQIDGLMALAARHPEMDMSRVGVYGWSFGGYFSAMAAMRRPDVFKCGVAGAPVADWRDYDTFYTERFMGLPDQNKAGYDASSVLTYCKDLQVPLLIIHGTADDNVYFMHSLKMCDALFRAGKDFEFLALPGFTHMVPDPVVTKSLYGRIADFFEKNLNHEPRP